MTWTKSQRNVVIAAYLGWTLDAFDFFLMVFMFKDISAEMHSSMQVTTTALLLTLGMRPVGALLFGRLADRFGRKPTLMWNILIYSVLELASGFAPSMTSLLIIRKQPMVSRSSTTWQGGRCSRRRASVLPETRGASSASAAKASTARSRSPKRPAGTPPSCNDDICAWFTPADRAMGACWAKGVGGAAALGHPQDRHLA